MYGALTIMANRLLPTADTDLRVGRLIHALGPTCEPIAPARKRVPLDVSDGRDLENLSPADDRALALELSDALTAFDTQLVEVAMPTIRLTSADLPQAQSGEDGWKNGAQAAALMQNLGVLFEFPEEPKT